MLTVYVCCSWNRQVGWLDGRFAYHGQSVFADSDSLFSRICEFVLPCLFCTGEESPKNGAELMPIKGPVRNPLQYHPQTHHRQGMAPYPHGVLGNRLYVDGSIAELCWLLGFEVLSRYD